MQGLTASHFGFLSRAAGRHRIGPCGAGLLLTQIIKMRGGHVIGRVSSPEKVAIAKEAGTDHVIVDTEGKFAEEAVSLSSGEGVHVVYDGSGPTTFQGSLGSRLFHSVKCI
jgi:NADPH2:quinone reductase